MLLDEKRRSYPPIAPLYSILETTSFVCSLQNWVPTPAFFLYFHYTNSISVSQIVVTTISISISVAVLDSADGAFHKMGSECKSRIIFNLFTTPVRIPSIYFGGGRQCTGYVPGNTTVTANSAFRLAFAARNKHRIFARCLQTVRKQG